jgi:hypothetical protein
MVGAGGPALAQLPRDLGVAQQDDVVGQEGDEVGAEAQLAARLHDLHGHEHGDAGPGQRAHQPVQRLAEILPEVRRQCQLEARDGIDGHPPRPDARHGRADRQQRLVRREVQRPDVDDGEAALAHHLLQVQAQALGAPQVLLGMLLEDGDDARLALPHPRRDELRGQHRLARAGRAADQHRISRRQPPAHQRVQARHAGDDPSGWPHLRGLLPGRAGAVRRPLSISPRWLPRVAATCGAITTRW